MNYGLTGLFTGFLLACLPSAGSAQSDSLIVPGEDHFTAIRQLTFSGENAEAYLDAANERLIFQSANDSTPCDQIFIMNLDGSGLKKVSKGGGKTTCSYFIPGTNTILYSSTRSAGSDCPPPPDFRKGYVWPIYPSFDIYLADENGNDIRPLTTTPGYDAEATVSVDGKTIVFTSMRDGDLDIYTMKSDGSDVKRLTSELGYDGGPFFSHDGTRIIYRAYHPQTEQEKSDYRQLLSENIIRPMNFEIWIMNADGTGKKKLTNTGMASFAPFFSPDDQWVIFSSNMADPVKKRNFDLFMVRADGSGEIRRITFSPGFDGFPMFTRDGKKLIFSSNRNNGGGNSTNVFVADWAWTPLTKGTKP